MSSLEPYDAVILAGGAARRMGGTDKPALDVAGATLLERVAAAVPDARRTIVVGPRRPSPSATYVREEPAGGGPVAALRAGLPVVTAPWFALLAGDLPFLEPGHVRALLEAARERSGAVYLDAESRQQWLLGAWRADAVRAALASYSGASLYRLLGPLEPAALIPEKTDPPLTLDCDTPESLARARALAGEAADQPAQPLKSANGTHSSRNPRTPRNSDR
ncbi:molybdopterin-guanine dinucleotide biosynthesis protein A [Lipingzhangella halophila]|uniref:Molybdopterin-guanine dinucleotide biosynthesis protein A n=1 Tax=Lipingzhangella halophila TaxID=1783352 RepID=A0A7W7W376_9ACTN|nr:molybdenum cofactor guanylyltransferase [Lipingzhangella halophila]MBB4931455.1 molybdopterin-guanine dinucleotide biosynthesis protein A [Lipingzhangella halophila]